MISMMNKSLFSHNSDDWRTPSFLMDLLIKNGFIDTFSYKSSIIQFEIMYYNSKVFINPPFSKLKLIPDYICNLLNNNNKIVLLLPSRTDTSYFHELLSFSPLIYFIKGRLHFNDSAYGAPFPTLLMFFSPLNKYGSYYDPACVSIEEFISLLKLG